MRKTCKFLEKFILVILIELLFVALFGVISFSFMHNAETNTLPMPHIVTIVFILFILGTIGTSVYMAFKAKEICVVSIKKTEPYLMFASTFAALMALAIFVYESIISVARGQMNAYFVFRATKWVLSLVLVAYFVIQALPKKFGKLRVHIPSAAKIGVSICAILWAVFGVLTVYFNALHMNDVSKVSQLLVYASIAVFFVFEGEFDNVKPVYKPYIISAITCSALTFGFPLGISISKIIGKFSPYGAFSQAELLLSFAIGFYAFAKMLAMVRTMRIVVDSKTNDHHKKFNKHKKAEESAEEIKAEEVVEVAEVSEK